jgi:amidase
MSSVDVRQVRTDRYSYVFGPYAEPIATVRPGELIDVFTDDAFGSRVQSEDDLPTHVLEWPYVNPQTGPIYVEGAEKGDTLAVEIVEIEPTRAFVASAHIPYFGGLTGTDRTALLNEPLPEQVFIYPLRDGQIELPRGIRIPYEPFLGTIATSPEIEAIATLVPGPFGGNMDVPDVCPGNTVRLPVSCEVTARVRLRLSVEKGSPVKWPRIESETELMAVGSARPMEDAARIAWVELIDWLEADYGFSRLEAYQLLTHAGRMRVGNMVDPLYSVAAKIERRFLPGREEG